MSNMMSKKKLSILTVIILGAVLVFAQAVWADGKRNEVSKPYGLAAAAGHAGHHPDAAPPENGINPMVNGSMDGMGKMGDMMQMMQTPEGKAMMERCPGMTGQPSAAASEG